jgi:hypothetical protein
MNITSNRPYTIYVKEYGDKTFYRVGLSKKLQDGSYQNGYMDIRFKGKVNIKDKDKIYLTNAFLSFYLSKDNHTIPYIQVMEYKTVADVIEETHIDIKKEDTEEDLFAEFGEEHKDDDLELPF